MKECYVSAKTSVLVNGSPSEEFPLKRGLRQGDSLSPFLFMLAAEGLHVTMMPMLESNIFTGYRIGRYDHIVIFHLQFADDTLFLRVKSWVNVRAMHVVLLLFEAMLGLKLIFTKARVLKLMSMILS